MTTAAPDAAAAAAGARTYELDRAHVFHSWSAQALISPMVIAGAEGSHVWDHEGKRYLDLSSQLVNVNIGHQHPKVVAAIRAQAEVLCTVAPQHANDQRSEAARLIAELAPGDLDKVFFTNGGADAIENAVRMARLHTGRHKVLTTYRSYHGNTATAIQMTGDPRRWANDGGATGVVHFFGPTPTGRRSGRRAPSRSASARSSTSSRSWPSRGRAPSPRSSWRRSPARRASSCHRTATSRECARSATGTASSTSPTR